MAILPAAALWFICTAAGRPMPTTPSAPVPEGDWGGVGIRIAVTARGAMIELDAAHGKTAGPLALDSDRRFNVAGTLVRDRPGPTRPGDADAPGDPVHYRGRVEEDVLTLEILPADKRDVIGPLKAVRGAPPRLRKML